MREKRIAKIALVLLPVFWPKVPPLGLASLKGFLSGEGIESVAIDYNNYFYNCVEKELQQEWEKSCNLSFERRILSFLQEFFSKEFEEMITRLLEFDAVGFSCYKSNSHLTQGVMEILKSRDPTLPLVLGGPEVTHKFLLRKEGVKRIYKGLADMLVVGEGELPLLSYIKGGREALVCFNEISSPERFPTPDYSDFDFNTYPRKKTMSLLMSRGCIRSCSFCAERLLYKKFRLSSLDMLILHIRDYKDRGIQNFVFHDSLINGDIKALELFCDRVIDEFGSIPWEAQIAIRKDMPDTLFAKMKESGCYHLFVGLESGSDRTLKRMRKGFSSQEAVGFFQALNAHNLSFGVSMIVGSPGETEEDNRDSLNFLLRHQDLIPKIEQINPFIPYDGTEMSSSGPYDPEISFGRARMFVEKIKEAGYKYTNAFIFNLVEE
jgi:radical SAM superfamily enzyme YgiQ (UPF0313 family)